MYSKDGKFSAQVLADASLEGNGIVGSIHKVSAYYLKKENHNGWTFWYVKRNNTLISIDQLRHEYEIKYLKNSQNYYELEFEKNSTVNEPEENFLTYGNNGL